MWQGIEGIQAAQGIAAETGLEHRPVVDGLRTAGIYSRSAMLDDDMGFSLVPWKPVIEQRLGQQLAATVFRGKSGSSADLQSDLIGNENQLMRCRTVSCVSSSRCYSDLCGKLKAP